MATIRLVRHGASAQTPSTARTRRLLVLADDLTGAADAAVALAGTELDAEVLLHRSLMDRARADVVSIDLDTRRMPVDAASRAVAEAIATVDSADRQLFKKIDSTLRGHLGAELAAMAQTLPAPRNGSRTIFVVAPAHPDLGRTMSDGRLLVHGKPAEGHPLLEGELESHGFTCTLLQNPKPDAGDAHMLRAIVDATAAPGPSALVCDAHSMHELRRIAALVLASGVQCIWVGSGGLAQALADVRTKPGAPMPSSSRPLASFVRNRAGSNRAGIVFAVGSFSGVAREQVRRLVRAGGVEQISLGIPTLLAASDCPDIRVRIDAALSRGADVAVCIDPDADVQPALAASLARALASTIAPQLGQLGALVVCGGDTSRALLDHIGADRLIVQSSTELGATRASTALHPGLPIILKAGAFGDEELLVRLRQQLSELDHSR